jgi:hypothetical protein
MRNFAEAVFEIGVATFVVGLAIMGVAWFGGEGREPPGGDAG